MADLPTLHPIRQQMIDLVDISIRGRSPPHYWHRTFAHCKLSTSHNVETKRIVEEASKLSVFYCNASQHSTFNYHPISEKGKYCDETVADGD